jgi:transposase InsO family protein
VKTCRWDFISTHAQRFGVQRLCRVLGASRSGYYRWQAGAAARRQRAEAEAATVAEIRAIHDEHRGAYGAPRVHAELRDRGRPVNHKRVRRLMRVHGIVGRHLRRRVRTTIADRAAPPAPDLVRRDFSAAAPDRLWCGDITYLPVSDGWLYLATVIDLYSRRVIGYSIADHMRTELITDAIDAAVATRGGQVAGVVFHSDRGAQYTSAEFATVCAQHDVARSMGRVGSSYDNAAAESLFASLKRELLHGRRYTSPQQLRLDVFEWLANYNTRRRHSAIGYQTPAGYERQTITGKLPTAA